MSAAEVAAPAPPLEEVDDEQLLDMWSRGPLNYEFRDRLLKVLQERNLFPRLMTAMDVWEETAGLYPDLDDPRFTEKLMQKQEFAESKQQSIKDQMKAGVNPCDPDREFELTPVQRFVSRFLSPQCPYQSALLFHGVGVGKTCAAITIAENYLEMYPRRSVFIIAPRNIQPGFRRTIFDDEALRIPEEDGVPNIAKGCTGNSYLKRTVTEYERDKKTVQRLVNESIQSRYTILGYIQFANYIKEILRRAPRSADPVANAEAEMKLLRREFSGRLVIIDEAHNLRDSPAEAVGDDIDVAGGDVEMGEAREGKILTESLLKVLDAAEGMKLVLATATPMYNTYKEIIFLMNLLLRNDKRDERIKVLENTIFSTNGEFVKRPDGTPVGEQVLGALANSYVSFMRGENPLSFPVRLTPLGVPAITDWKEWPALSPDAIVEVSESERKRIVRLPFVPVQFEGNSAGIYEELSTRTIETGKMSLNSVNDMVQSGNWLFPGDEGKVQIHDYGFDASFKNMAKDATGSKYKCVDEDSKWLLASNLGTVSPKAKLVIDRLKTCSGIAFVNSRFIKSGVLPLALALEANGYTRWGQGPLLEDGIMDGLGRQCALCENREADHRARGHAFVPAKYVLITGNSAISPNNAAAIQAARALTNIDGKEVKVILGSAVASEGVDFRFVREIYVFDSWYHLNKMEQILGRGIRTCSHSLLPPEKRNCTIHLLVNTFSATEGRETADMYMYRNALEKALKVGRVTRVLKKYALDCNLNRDAIVVTGLATQRHVDSQKVERPEVDINDTPYTYLCDWLECEYNCAKPVKIDENTYDISTYDEYAVRWREVEIKKAIRAIFEQKKQAFIQFETIAEALQAIPKHALAAIISEIVGNRSFQLTVNGVNGYIVYRNGYYLFQPDYLADVRIPLAVRLSDVPVRRDRYTPMVIKPAVPAVAAAVAPAEENLTPFWNTIKGWAAAMSEQTAVTDRVPTEVVDALKARYSGDQYENEYMRFSMVNWLYEFILTSKEYAPDKKSMYLDVLADVFLEFVWDESLPSNEQMALIQQNPDEKTLAVAREQIVKSGPKEAFRIINVMNGETEYYSGNIKQSPAVSKIFDNEASDPLNTLKANKDTTGNIYGFIVPKKKKGQMTFKTGNDALLSLLVLNGASTKGTECSIVSTMTTHIAMLKDIAKLMVEEGYPRFLLIDDILDEKKKQQKAKKAGAKDKRIVENAIRACTLKDIILRWMDRMQELELKGGTREVWKRYFYRPIAAKKTGHQGSFKKEAGRAPKIEDVES